MFFSKRAFSGQLKGEKRSTKRGTSIEFADYRDYSHGDDLRRVDWNTFARLDRLFDKPYYNVGTAVKPLPPAAATAAPP